MVPPEDKTTRDIGERQPGKNTSRARRLRSPEGVVPIIDDVLNLYQYLGLGQGIIHDIDRMLLTHIFHGIQRETMIPFDTWQIACQVLSDYVALELVPREYPGLTYHHSERLEGPIDGEKRIKVIENYYGPLHFHKEDNDESIESVTARSDGFSIIRLTYNEIIWTGPAPQQDTEVTRHDQLWVLAQGFDAEGKPANGVPIGVLKFQRKTHPYMKQVKPLTKDDAEDELHQQMKEETTPSATAVISQNAIIVPQLDFPVAMGRLPLYHLMAASHAANKIRYHGAPYAAGLISFAGELRNIFDNPDVINVIIHGAVGMSDTYKPPKQQMPRRITSEEILKQIRAEQEQYGITDEPDEE